ncbi:MAG TPA: UvrD-helicase domain-containing protein [Candidatus Cloacimonadota bacterium]|nr:UvrD-helicase domain-containing protein [Candidatus Cloacimonadota bacterium]
MFLNKVISASAGTGKTYRLSLEFINILLQCRVHDINFWEICIITFTRKATAEIRARIYQHLDTLTSGQTDNTILISNLESIMDRKVNDEDIAFLRDVRQQILLHKNKLQISTIDSLLFNVFRSHVAPYLGITEPVIDDNAVDDILPRLYEFTLNDRNLDVIRPLFENSRSKTIETYEKFLKTLIDQRWFFHYLDESVGAGVPSNPSNATDDHDSAAWEQLASQYWLDYSSRMISIITQWWGYMQAKYPGELLSKLMKKDYREQLTNGRDGTNFNIATLAKDYFQDLSKVEKKSTLWLKCTSFWNSVKFSSRKEPLALELEEQLEEASRVFGSFLFYHKFLPEQKAIRNFNRLLYEYYDQLRFQTRIFTYSDIAYYTYRYLYDPELSLIDKEFGYVNNRFYELLTNRIRFLLIDEFQDTSIIQFQILLPIIRELISGETAKPYGGVIVVGDEKQSIYRWRGGERNLLMDMKKVLTNCVEDKLSVSFRSFQPVMSFINYIFLHENLYENLQAHEIRWDYTSVEPEPAHCVEKGGVHVRFQNLTKDENNPINDDESACRNFVEEIIIPLIDREQGKLAQEETVVLARRNQDLKYIASVLTENGYDFIWESTYSILHHASVKPLMHLLMFTLKKRWIDLFKFLRSDAVLLGSDVLKKMLLVLQDKERESLREEMLRFPEVSRVFHVMEQFRNENILDYCTSIIKEYRFTEIWSNENDIKNLHRFLDIVSDFEQTKADQPLTLKGFMAFCRELEKNKSIGQIGMQTREGLTLLTIHRAKGLQFNNVFLYTKAEGGRGGTSSTLKIYQKLKQPMYSELEQDAFTCNYEAVINQTELQTLVAEEVKQQCIEELNTTYVALTRAAQNLVIYMAYTNKDGLEDAVGKLTTSNNDLSIPKLLLNVLYNATLTDEWEREDEIFMLDARYGDMAVCQPSEPGKRNDLNADMRKYVEADRLKYAVQKPNLQEYLETDLKQSYLVNKSVMIGNAVHYMLSFLTYAEEGELHLAKLKTIELYGHYLSPVELEQVENSVRGFIQNSPDIFSRTWTKVFTEFTLYDKYNQEFRLDRLLIDEVNKKILIVDYKTGEISDEEQLENYRNLLIDLPIVKKGKYTIATQYVEM